MDHLESPEFETHVKELMQQHHVPGVSVAVTLKGKDTAVSFGHSSLDPPKPCTVATLFDIASSSKSLTAASVALLVEDDEKYPEIKWETPVSTLLPEDFVLSEDEYTKGITVEDILCHRTGMANHDLAVIGFRAKQPYDARAVTRNLRNLPLRTPIRSEFIYNNNMFTVATHLVESKVNTSFSDFLEKRILEPLGMHDTSLQPHRAQAKGHGDRISMRHVWIKDDVNYKSFPAFNCPEGQGAGSIVTSAVDYLKWVKALMNKEACITQEIYKTLTEPRTLRETNFQSLYPLSSLVLYALGLEVSWYRGHMVIGHNGLISGFGSRHFFLPDFNFGAVILGNADGADTIANILSNELIDEVIDTPKQDRPDWNTIETSRVENAEARYEKEDGVDSQRERLCPGLKHSLPQASLLSNYTGVFHNVGYHDFTVQVRNDRLFIDASDRGDGYILSLEHVCDQTKYIAHLSNLECGGKEALRAEFVLKDGKASRLGLNLEPEIEEYIWFDRV